MLSVAPSWHVLAQRKYLFLVKGDKLDIGSELYLLVQGLKMFEHFMQISVYSNYGQQW